jgi:two-component system response regulator (stage 0 sporulation protein F)
MKKILVVEDEKALSLLYKEELTEEGYKVTAVLDAEAALEALAKERFDLIITDIRMPGKNGIDLVTRVLSRQPDIPIIINTAYQSYKSDFKTWAADAYVVKSSSLEELKAKIKELIEKPHVPTQKRPD